MSLLLDALQRASKDKERAAAAAAGAARTPAPAAPSIFNPPSSEPENLAVSFPDLAAPPEPQPAPPPEVTPPDRELQLETRTLPTPPVQAPRPPEPPLEIELTMEAPAQSPPPLTQEPLALEQQQAPTPTPSFVTQAPSPAPPQARPPMTGAETVAALQQAYGKPAPSLWLTHRRALVLAGVTLILAVLVGTWLEGLWGNSAQLLGASSQSTLATTPPPPPMAPSAPAASPEPAPVAQTAPAAEAANTNTSAAPPAARASAPMAAPPANAASAPKPMPPPPEAKPAKELAFKATPTTPVFSTRPPAQKLMEDAYSALLSGRLDDAARAYESALANSPGERDALLGLAYIAHNRGQRDQAQSYYRQVLRQDPSNTVAQAGLVALDVGAPGTQNATAADQAKALAQRQSESGAAQALLGEALARDGQVAEAALAFARAMSLEPQQAVHAFNLAVAQDRLGNYGAAVDSYERALATAPDTVTGLKPGQIAAARSRLAQLRQALAAKAAASP